MRTSNASRPAVAVAIACLAALPGLSAARAGVEQARDGLELVEGAAPGKVREPTPLAPTRPAAPATPASPAAPIVEGKPETGALRLGATGGIDLADGFTGFAVHPQVAYTLATLGPRLHLELAGHLAIALGGATGYSATYLAIIPAARLRHDLGSGLALYGDMGLGFFVLRTSLDNGLGTDTQTGAVLRIPVGLRYALSPSLDFVFEPAALGIYFNTNGNKFHYSALAGILLRI
jgi:hypothetical protein